jgi:transcriptional regulator with XRE-family HTH domain
MTLGSTIRLLRQAVGLTQKEFAEELRITPSYLSLLETDKREPTIPLLRNMAERLGSPATLLFAAALGSSLGEEQAREIKIISQLVEAVRLNLIQKRLPLELAPNHEAI